MIIIICHTTPLFERTVHSLCLGPFWQLRNEARLNHLVCEVAHELSDCIVLVGEDESLIIALLPSHMQSLVVSGVLRHIYQDLMQ